MNDLSNIKNPVRNNKQKKSRPDFSRYEFNSFGKILTKLCIKRKYVSERKIEKLICHGYLCGFMQNKI